MGRPKRNILAAATESTTPPDELTKHQFVARVGKPEGNNTYTCILPNTKTTLVELAQRFRNTIWIKRGGYVVVDLTPSEERSKTNNKVAGEIINVVRDEKEWRKMPYWYELLWPIFGLHCLSTSWRSTKWLSTYGRRLVLTKACYFPGPENSQRTLTLTRRTTREVSHQQTPKTRTDSPAGLMQFLETTLCPKTPSYHTGRLNSVCPLWLPA